MAKVFLIFLLLFSAVAFSQDTVQQYNKSVNEAELYITSGEYHAAITAYENAFEQRKQPFNADLYNAAVCWLKLGNWQNGKKYLNKLAQRGVSFEELNNRAFSSLGNNTYWKQYAFLHSQFFEEAALDPALSFITNFYVNYQILEDSLSFYGYNRTAELIGDTLLITTRSAGRIVSSQKVIRNGANTRAAILPDKLNPEQTPEVLQLRNQIQLLKEVTQDKFETYISENDWPDEKTAGMNKLTFTENDFYQTMLSIYNFNSMPSSQTRTFKNKSVTFVNKISIDSLNGLQKQNYQQLSSIVKSAVSTGRFPSINAFKLLHPETYRNFPKQQIVMLRLTPDAECRELYNQYNGKYMNIPTNSESIEERFSIAKQELNLPTRDEMNRKYIFVNSQETDFVFDITRREEETSLSTCFTLKEFLATATVLE